VASLAITDAAEMKFDLPAFPKMNFHWQEPKTKKEKKKKVVVLFEKRIFF
jgi:hypothetical protein